MLGGLQWRAAPRRGSSAAGQHVHVGHARQALRGLLSAPAATGAPSRVKLRRWPCIGGGLDAARQRGRGAFRGACAHAHLRWWRMERAVARDRGSASCGGSQELHDADLSVWGQKPTNTHLRPGMDSHEATGERHGDSAGGHVDDWGCRVRSSRAIWRAVRKFLVAASGSAVYATRLLRRAKIWRRCWKILISRLVPKKNGCQMTLLVRMHERCCRAARLVKAFAARYRLHRADPALWCVVIFDRTVAVDCVHVSVISLWFQNWQSSW